MDKKKKVDLSTELADLLMGDEVKSTAGKSEALPTTVNLNDQKLPQVSDVNKSDPDPTIAIGKETVLKKEDDRTLSTKEDSLKSEIPEKNTSTKDRAPTESVVQKDSVSGAGLSGIFASAKKVKSQNDVLLTAEASLIQSEQLRIAQQRISELEVVVETLRRENEGLVAAGETLKNRSDSLTSQIESLQKSLREKGEIHVEEMAVLKLTASSRAEENTRLKMKIEELESRLSGDLKKIRVRERELENRLELVKLEGQAVLKNKDEIILDLKRRIDQLGFEMENYRTKSKDLNKHLEDQREKVRRTVKALRLALNMLEGDEDEVSPLKKAE